MFRLLCPLGRLFSGSFPGLVSLDSSWSANPVLGGISGVRFIIDTTKTVMTAISERPIEYGYS